MATSRYTILEWEEINCHNKHNHIVIKCVQIVVTNVRNMLYSYYTLSSHLYNLYYEASMEMQHLGLELELLLIIIYLFIYHLFI